jgi:hypothetical protein
MKPNFETFWSIDPELKQHTNLKNCTVYSLYVIRFTLFLRVVSNSLGGGGRSTARAVSRRPLTAEDRIRSLGRPYVICRGQSDHGRGFSQRPSVGFPLSLSFHQCSIFMHSFIHTLQTLYNLRKLRVSLLKTVSMSLPASDKARK